MKDRPIIFSGPMVRSILEGRKSQTRRVVKLPKVAHDVSKECNRGLQLCHECNEIGCCDNFFRHSCPYGKPGDRLFVRETHQIMATEEGWVVRYSADNAEVLTDCCVDEQQDSWIYEWSNKRPSIHMPKWACRLWLEVVDVRVERLQDISEADAVAEGFKPIPHFMGGFALEPPIMEFRRIWDSLNAKKPGCSWEDNPWVFVVEFKRVESEEEQTV